MFKHKFIAYMGRFQIAHLGHYKMLEKALELGENVIVVVGSAFGARSPKNPFSYSESVKMLKSYLTKKQLQRVTFIAQPDLWNDSDWVQAVSKKIKHITGKKKCALISHIKDESGYYQKLFPQFEIEAMPLFEQGLSATTLRALLLDKSLSVPAKLESLEPYVGAKTLPILEKWLSTEVATELADEAEYYKDYKKMFVSLPWEPTFNTSDAVVTCVHNGVRKVLLVVRGKLPGKGCLAFPGGFLDPKDTYKAASLRELLEETGIEYTPTQIQKIYKGREIFDHPARSLRGRVITVAHMFDLGVVKSLPKVEGLDDAASSHWVSLEKCVKNKHKFFEDHFWAMFRHFFADEIHIPV